MVTNHPYTFERLDEAIIHQAASLYATGMSIREVGKALGKSYGSANLYLKAAGVKARPSSKRVHTLDETFFDEIDSPEKAYWLGFLLADGNVSTRSVRVSLKESDRNHVEKLRVAVKAGSEVKIQKNAVPGRWKATLVMSSIHMRDALLSKGWDEFKKKGDLRIVESVPEVLRRHLLRGLFDGDGWITEMSNDSPLVGFVDSHESPVVWWRDSLCGTLDIKAPPVKRAGSSVKKKNAFNVKISCFGRVRAIRDFFYSEPGPYLERKKARFDVLLT